MNKWMLLLIAAMVLSFAMTVGISCGDDDDDDDNDAADDDDDDDNDTAGNEICKNGVVIDPIPEGMTPTSNCISCHDGGTADVAHDGVYDDDAPGSCMVAYCHSCE